MKVSDWEASGEFGTSWKRRSGYLSQNISPGLWWGHLSHQRCCCQVSWDDIHWEHAEKLHTCPAPISELQCVAVFNGVSNLMHIPWHGGAYNFVLIMAPVLSDTYLPRKVREAHLTVKWNPCRQTETVNATPLRILDRQDLVEFQNSTTELSFYADRKTKIKSHEALYRDTVQCSSGVWVAE